MLALASPQYSRFLHEQGYEGLKLFTFSQLLIRGRNVVRGKLEGRGNLTLFISSPVTEFMENLAQGFLSEPELLLCDQRFRVERLEILPRPDLQEEANFTCLSPIVVSRGGEKHATYLPYDSPQLSQAVRQNLQRKLRLLGRPKKEARFELWFDQDYIQARQGQAYRLVDYKGIKIKGILSPFKVRGDRELLEVGYEAGFGEKNSLGFGMVELIHEHRQPQSRRSNTGG